jgi:trigger factor
LQIQKKEISPVELELTVEIPAEEMATRVESSLSEVSSKVQIPGFRRGHVPRKIVEQRFGDAITSEAVEKSLQDYYKAALKEAEIEPVSPGSMGDVSFKPGEPLVFKVTVEKAPDFGLPDVSKIAVELEEPQISEEDVLEAIDRLRENQAVLHPTEEPINEDSVLTLDLQELDASGFPIIGRAQRDVQIDMRQNPLGKDFAERVIGGKQGMHVRLTMPSGSRSEKDKPASILDIEVKSVRRKELPPFDDDFAASVNPNTPTVQDLKDSMRRSLGARAQAFARRKMHNRLIDELLHIVEFPVPPRMLDDHLERIAHDALGEEHEDSEKPEHVERLKQAKEDYRAMAIRSIRWHFLRQKFISVHDLDAKEEDLQREFESLAKLSGKSVRDIEVSYKPKERWNDLHEAITDRKVFGFLEKQIKIVPSQVNLATLEGRGPQRIVMP